MAIDKNCVIEVGTHEAPYFTLHDGNPNWTVCIRHARQYVEFGTYSKSDFIRVEPKE